MTRYLILLLVLCAGCEVIVPIQLPPDTFELNDSEPVNMTEHSIASKAICHWNVTSKGWLPDPECSPGDVFRNCGKAEICTPGYTETVRNVSANKKDQVYNNYGVLTRLKGEWEMDHIIPLTLCGSNDALNLFPQPAEPKLGFHEKDWLEVKGRDLVCSGNISLQEAQVRIASNWIEFYEEYHG
jgi:hypothetical protein